MKGATQEPRAAPETKCQDVVHGVLCGSRCGVENDCIGSSRAQAVLFNKTQYSLRSKRLYVFWTEMYSATWLYGVIAQY